LKVFLEASCCRRASFEAISCCCENCRNASQAPTRTAAPPITWPRVLRKLSSVAALSLSFSNVRPRIWIFGTHHQIVQSAAPIMMQATGTSAMLTQPAIHRPLIVTPETSLAEGRRDQMGQDIESSISRQL